MSNCKSVATVNVVEEESQFDRIEKKMDRILELLEGKELSDLYIRPIAGSEIRISATTLSKAIENKTINCGKLS